MSYHDGPVRPADARGRNTTQNAECRDLRLQELKSKIRQGTYKPDIRDIANYLVRVIEPDL